MVKFILEILLSNLKLLLIRYLNSSYYMQIHTIKLSTIIENDVFHSASWCKTETIMLYTYLIYAYILPS